MKRSGKKLLSAKEDEHLPPAHDQADALYRTKRLTTDAMGVVINYWATIARVKQMALLNEIIFVTSKLKNDDDNTIEDWREEPLDAYVIRAEFLKVKTEREALNFLRDTGEFLPYGDRISWSEFRLWQRLAELVMERDALATAHKAVMAKAPTIVDPELEQVLRLLTGTYPHTYFGEQSSPPSAIELKQLRRSSEVLSETPRQATERYQEALAAIREGTALRNGRRRELESWFYAPPHSAFSIEFFPKNPDPILDQTLRRGGALLDYLYPREDLIPVLFIHARCTVEAIAASIYAERFAKIRFRKCPGCQALFELRNQKNKQYCDDPRCKFRVKKRNQRKNKGRVNNG